MDVPPWAIMDVGNRYNYLRPQTIFLLPRFQISAPILANRNPPAKIHHPKYIHVFVVGETHIKSVLHQNEFISRFAWMRSLQEILLMMMMTFLHCKFKKFFTYQLLGTNSSWAVDFGTISIQGPHNRTAQCRYIKSKCLTGCHKMPVLLLRGKTHHFTLSRMQSCSKRVITEGTIESHLHNVL